MSIYELLHSEGEINRLELWAELKRLGYGDYLLNNPLFSEIVSGLVDKHNAQVRQLADLQAKRDAALAIEKAEMPKERTPSSMGEKRGFDAARFYYREALGAD